MFRCAPHRRPAFPASAVLAAILTALVALAAGAATDGDLRLGDYHADNPLIASPSATGGSLAAFANPAAWGANDRTEAAFWWTDREGESNGLDDWGFSWGRRLGLAVRHRTYADLPDAPHATDWQLGATMGSRRAVLGAAWRWSGGESAAVPRERAVSLGFIHRPGRHLSWGIAGTQSVESKAARMVCDIGLRPFRTPWATIYGDYSLRRGQHLADGLWGLGAELRPVGGLRCGVKMQEDPDGDGPRFIVQAGIALPRLGLRSAAAYDDDGELLATTHALRTGSPEAELHPGELPRLPGFHPPARPGRILSLDLQRRRLTHRTHRWFDGGRIAWLPLARALDEAARRPDVGGVALNLSGFSARPSLAWELRRSLAGLQAAGKKVFVHADDLDLLGLWVASVADRLILDPQAFVTIPGLDAGRTYLKDMLAKLGVGFEAFQYFPHKTAVEILARDEMSEADREQRGRMIDVVYETVRADVCRARGLEFAAFDAAVDDEVMMPAARAVELGLIDGVGRWNDLMMLVEREHGRAAEAWDVAPPRIPAADRWGEPPEIAVVYAVGSCAMDKGIKARETARLLRGLMRDPDVWAVVLRVDSPGGDPMASDLVAEAVRDLRSAGYPVVISQGDVAASGGYWLSMDGSRVLTTPVTVTGSIGVISGWAWDRGLGDRLGVRADGVSRGAHADLFRRVRLPLLGLSLPARGLDAHEREMVRERILGMYDRFVAAVAAGRELDEARVRELGGGRVWMGPDAIAGGLCDAEGGLLDAVAAARELVGIGPREDVRIAEYPPRKLFALPKLPFRLPGAFAAGAGPDEPDEPSPETSFLLRIAERPGAPLLMLPPGILPAGWADDGAR